jgi:predicted DNA-binding transcriptional regulator AlpA
MPPSVQLDDPLLDARQVGAIFGKSARSVDRWCRLKIFPQPLRIGQQRCLRWRKSTILAFIAKQEAAAQAV